MNEYNEQIENKMNEIIKIYRETNSFEVDTEVKLPQINIKRKQPIIIIEKPEEQEENEIKITTSLDQTLQFDSNNLITNESIDKHGLDDSSVMHFDDLTKMMIR